VKLTTTLQLVTMLCGDMYAFLTHYHGVLLKHQDNFILENKFCTYSMEHNYTLYESWSFNAVLTSGVPAAVTMLRRIVVF